MKQASARFVQSQLVDEVGRCGLEEAFENSTEMTRAKTGSLGQAFDGKFVLEMRQNPTRQISESIGGRGLPGSRLNNHSCHYLLAVTAMRTRALQLRPRPDRNLLQSTQPSSRCRRGCRRRCRIARPSGTSPCKFMCSRGKRRATS